MSRRLVRSMGTRYPVEIVRSNNAVGHKGNLARPTDTRAAAATQRSGQPARIPSACSVREGSAGSGAEPQGPCVRWRADLGGSRVCAGPTRGPAVQRGYMFGHDLPAGIPEVLPVEPATGVVALVEPELPVELLLVAALAIATPPPPRAPATARSATPAFIDLMLLSPCRLLTNSVKLLRLWPTYGKAESSPIAEIGGAPTSPGWYHKLKAHPNARSRSEPRQSRLFTRGDRRGA